MSPNNRTEKMVKSAWHYKKSGGELQSVVS